MLHTLMWAEHKQSTLCRGMDQLDKELFNAGCHTGSGGVYIDTDEAHGLCLDMSKASKRNTASIR